jgi:hypothetical protein
VIKRSGRMWSGTVIGIAFGAALFLLPASASADYLLLETFGSAAQPSFTTPQGLAVDQSTGDLLVIDAGAGTLSRYNEDGTPSTFSSLGSNVIPGLTFGSAGEVQVAVDNSGGETDGNIYVTQAGAHRIEVFGEDGSLLEQLTGYEEGPGAEGPAKLFGEVCGVAVDPSGNLYVTEFGFSTGAIHKYEPAGAFPKNEDNVANFTFQQSCTLAAGAGPTAGSIFPTQIFTGVASKLDGASGVKAYDFGSGATTVTVNPDTGHVFTIGGGEVKEYDASGASEAELVESFSPGAALTGVAVNETTGRVYVARSGNPNIEVWGSVLLPKVTTEAVSFIDDTIILHGVVNANAGPPATCVFQYVEVSANGFEGATSVPVPPLGPFTGTSNESLSVEASGLAEATYRYRLLCSTEDGEAAGETLFFDTFEKVPGLPDGRAYEMVSPPQKAGEVIPPEPTGALSGSCSDCLPGGNVPSMPMQSSPGGESVLYLGQPFGGGLASGPNEYLAPRSPGQWGTQSLSSPTTTGRFVAFSADLSRSVLAQANPPLSPQAPTRGGEDVFSNLYLRESGSLEPLITSEPPNRDPGDFRVSFSGANAGTALVPAFGQVAFEANDALTDAVPTVAPAAPEVEVGKACSLPGANCNLYEWEGGELSLVNVLPGNITAAAGAVIGSGRMLELGSPLTEQPNTDQAISDDGTRIFWSSEETGQVYARVEGKETLEIPGPASCKESVAVKERACFLTASPDGSAVLLSDGKLYELNEAGTAYLESVDLSEGQGGFEGILGAAEDFSRVYFIDTAALTAESEENENGEHAEANELNLYSFEDEESGFIGMLLPADNGFSPSSYGAWAASPSQRTAQVTSNGAWLAFMSLAPVTGYDNTRAGGDDCRNSNTPACREVFVYSADPGSLACASCNPTGEQPLGDSNLTLVRPTNPFRQPGNLSREGEGRLFFESQDTLSPRDTNGSIQDVYEWEPDGVGTCQRAEGCVYLISSGNSPDDSMFMDSSASGDDAFFITREQLLPRDKNQQLDLYDARVGGGFEEPADAPCSPEACAGPLASPPAQPSFGSEESTSSRNPQPKPKPCKPGFVKKQGKCVKKKHKKKRARHSSGGTR